MATIAVTGGKGGAGKTTIATMLAKEEARKGRKVLLIDADVECPNAYIFFGGLGKEVGKAYQSFPEISSKCVGCGLCVKHCPSKALIQLKPRERPVLLEEMCEGCKVCSYVCPVGAIEMKRKAIGSFYLKEGNPALLTGVAKEGIEETGGIVEQLMEKAEGIEADVKIVDTAAGIHCNVIRALDKADAIIVVIEETPLGLRDGKEIIKVIKEMGKENIEIIINKGGLSREINERIREMAKMEGIRIKREIPYDSNLAKAYAEGKL